MNRTTKITASVIAGFFIAVTAWRVYFEGHQIALEERFPNIDEKVIRDVHRQMFRDGLRGAYDNIDTDDDAVMDAIFLKMVEDLN